MKLKNKHRRLCFENLEMRRLLVGTTISPGIILTSVDGVTTPKDTITSLSRPYDPSKSASNNITVYADVFGLTPDNYASAGMECECTLGDADFSMPFTLVGVDPIASVNSAGVSIVVKATLNLTTISSPDYYQIEGWLFVGTTTTGTFNSARVQVCDPNPPDFASGAGTSTYDPASGYAGLDYEIGDGGTVTVSAFDAFLAETLTVDSGGILDGLGLDEASYNILYAGGMITTGITGTIVQPAPSPPAPRFDGMGMPGPDDPSPSDVVTMGGDCSSVPVFQVRDNVNSVVTSLPDAFVGIKDGGVLTFTDTDPSVGSLNGDEGASVVASGTLTITGVGGDGAFAGNISDGDSAASLVINGSQLLVGTQDYTGSTMVNGTLGIAGNVTNLAIGDGGTIQTVADTTLSSGFTIPDDAAAIATIDTNGFNVTLSATVAGTGQLRVTGGGTLNLTGSIAAAFRSGRRSPRRHRPRSVSATGTKPPGRSWKTGLLPRAMPKSAPPPCCSPPAAWPRCWSARRGGLSSKI